MQIQSSEARAPWRTAAWLFASALVLRALVASLAQGASAGLSGDETLYLARAEACLRLLGSAWQGTDGSAHDAAVFYQQGIWPPLHAIWMAAFIALPIDPVLAARLSVSVVGAASSALAFFVARTLGGERAGIAAGALHAALPLCVYYGVSLWSESLYAALGLALMAALLAWLRSGAFTSALMAGLALGAMGLTRAAVVPFLLLVPLFMLGAHRTRRSAAHAALVVASALCVLAPWNAQLSAREGEPTFFSSRTGVQIWAGNNPYEGALLDYGATVATFRKDADRALRVAQLEAEHLGEPADRTARRLALAHIAANPLRFAWRCVERALVLLSHDSFMLRFFATTTAPPLPMLAWLGLWLGSLLGFSCIVGLAALAFASDRLPKQERWLFAAGIVCVLGAPIVSVSHTRLAYPALVLVLPVAGVGWALWREEGASSRGRRAFAVSIAASIALLGVAILPIHLRVSAQTSSWYAADLAAPLGWMPVEPVYVDFLELRGRGGRGVELRGGRPGIEFPRGGGEAAEAIVLEGARARDRIRVHTRGAAGVPLEVRLPRREGGIQALRFDPVDAEHWNEWVSLGEGLEFRWRGGELPESLRSR